VLAELYGHSGNFSKTQQLQNYPNYQELMGESLRNMVRGPRTGFTNDKELIITSHFSILNPENISNDELVILTNEVIHTIAAQAGVNTNNVKMLHLEPTGSATAQIKILYPADTIDLEEKKDNFIEFISDPQNVSDMFDSIIGLSQILDITEARKRSVDAKLNEIDKRLESTFKNLSFFHLSNFKFEVLEDKLIINRFDNDQDTFVGAELVLD
jgi:hypothetical protein